MIEGRTAHRDDGGGGGDDDVTDVGDSLLSFPSESEGHGNGAFFRSRGHPVEDSPVQAMATPVEAAKGHSAAATEVRAQLRETEITIQWAVEEAGNLKVDLDCLRAATAQLTQQYTAVEKALREASERTAAHAVIDLEKSRGLLDAGLEQVSRVRDIVNRELARFDKEVQTRLELARSDIETLIVQNRNSHCARADVPAHVRAKRYTDAPAEFAVQMRAGMKTFMEWKNGRISPRLLLTRASMMTQKMTGFIKYRRAIVGVLALTTLVVARPGGNADHVGAEKPVVAAALNASARALPDPKSAVVLPTMQVVTTAAQFFVGHPLLKAPVQPPELVETQAVESDVARAALFVDRQHVGKSLVQLPRVRAAVSDPTLASTLPRVQAATTAKAKAPVKPRALKPPVRPIAYLGTLAVESDPPGAAVFINRQRVGETPVQVPQVRAGSHVVWIEREGYQRWTAGVLVPSDRLTQVSIRLRPEPGR